MSNPPEATGHDTTSVVLSETSFRHPAGTCGERVPSPHSRCQARFEPFMAAERFRLRDAVVILCRCRAAWRETSTAEAAA